MMPVQSIRPSAGRSIAPPRNLRTAVAAQHKQKGAVVSAEQVQLALLLTVASAAPAYAYDVDDSVGVAVEGVKAAGELLKAGGRVVSEAYTKVSPKINEAVDSAKPYLKQGVDEANRVVVPAVKDAATKAVPIVSEGTKSFLRSSGVDVEAVETTAETATRSFGDVIGKATPFATKVSNFISSSSPQTLAKLAAAAVVVYYLTPFFLRTAVSSLRGYAGEISPARAVDVVASDAGVVLIDIRSLREKSAVGVPDVPSSARGRFIELEVAEVDRRLRGQLKSVDVVEAQVTALEIQALKRLNKGTKVLLLDKNGVGTAKQVAKELSKLGFRNVFVIAGGFAGWTSSKLQVKTPVAGGRGGSTFANILGTISTRKPTPAASKKK